MTLGGLSDEHHQGKIGLGFLVAGLLLLGWAWGSWLYRTSKVGQAIQISDSPRPAAHADEEKAAAEKARDRQTVIRSMPLVLWTVFVLVIVFLGGSLILVRTLRRQQESASRRRDPPTAAEDVWRMRKDPENE